MARLPFVEDRYEKTGSPVAWLKGGNYALAKVTEKVVAWADALVGVREMGRNKGSDVERFQEVAGLGKGGGFAWCAAFVYWILIRVEINPDLLPRIGKCAAVRNWASWAEQKGRRRDIPKRGRLFYWLNENGTGHIGICLGISVMGVFRTIEGNTDGESGSREGDGVYKRTRTTIGLRRKYRHGFIDLEGLQ